MELHTNNGANFSCKFCININLLFDSMSIVLKLFSSYRVLAAYNLLLCMKDWVLNNCHHLKACYFNNENESNFYRSVRYTSWLVTKAVVMWNV